TAQTVVREEWAEKWKEFFQPQALGEQFFLIPKWRRQEGLAADRIPIVLDPGMAFGTGLHESTRLCVELLETVVNAAEPPRVLDAGTGSGILAIVAYKLGARAITAVDVDPVAVEVAKENCAENNCPGIDFKVCSADHVTGEFDIIVANILLEAHLQSLRAYRERLRTGGKLILSGLLVSQRETIRAALLANGFLTVTFLEQGEWLSCLA
ncbi:MAG: 50S ribosomal protein L11 methyltransferase, partial [Bdellovibrionales bacterium]|nr:50S ribosomal protein L11 methyltransferase [Bdellovibrionales bacterium]